jgi:hypothetical protein
MFADREEVKARKRFTGGEEAQPRDDLGPKSTGFGAETRGIWVRNTREYGAERFGARFRAAFTNHELERKKETPITVYGKLEYHIVNTSAFHASIVIEFSQWKVATFSFFIFFKFYLLCHAVKK